MRRILGTAFCATMLLTGSMFAFAKPAAADVEFYFGPPAVYGPSYVAPPPVYVEPAPRWGYWHPGGWHRWREYRHDDGRFEHRFYWRDRD